MLTTKTLQESLFGDHDAVDENRPPTPGVVLVWHQDGPACATFPLGEGALSIGRDRVERGLLADPLPADPAMSRQHAEVRLDGQAFRVRDLASRNGTFVDGVQVQGEVRGEHLRVVRAGASIFLLCRDIRPFQAFGIERMDGLVLGPGLMATWRVIARLARAGSSMCLHGESGVGKERAVQAFHTLGQRSGRPLVAVNCGAIPEGMAERLLFGTKRGAYSGATADAPGYVQAADGGVLFLDEVAELDLVVQAKLLRVLETKEVMPLGENRPRQVDFQLCAATHKDLRQEIARGRFRQDLYFRLGRPEVRLPPLRERIEEIPWLIDMVVGQTAEQGLTVHVTFVEACLLRRWPGNVRELITETRSAVHQALAQGSKTLRESHLSPAAGMGFPEVTAPAAEPGTSGRAEGQGQKRAVPSREEIEDSLRQHEGNVAATARALRVHRTQLRRWLTRYGIDAGKLAGPGGAAGDTEGGEDEEGAEGGED